MMDHDHPLNCQALWFHVGGIPTSEREPPWWYINGAPNNVIRIWLIQAEWFVLFLARALAPNLND